jgi:hypothetical protein
MMLYVFFLDSTPPYSSLVCLFVNELFKSPLSVYLYALISLVCRRRNLVAELGGAKGNNGRGDRVAARIDRWMQAPAKHLQVGGPLRGLL